MDSREDKIALAALSAYAKLPKKSKPLRRDNSTEWVPLSGIVLETGGELTCVALGTGMKCLPKAKIPLAAGVVLHDFHAEVLAIRGFNRFLLEECKMLSVDGLYVSKFIRRRDLQETSFKSPQPFTLLGNVHIHIYSSEAPCGDGSMELTMASQDDPTPWTAVPISPLDTLTPTTLLQGRGYFSELGAVRTKPGRADSPLTMSKSCSDKYSLRQVVSTLLSPASLIISPAGAYISSMILPASEYSATACARAFTATGRMAPLVGMKWDEYGFIPFAIKTTSLAFEFSRRTVGVGAVGSNISALWVANAGAETLICGVLQGRKQFASGVKGASMISKMLMWKLVRHVAEMEKITDVSGERYGAIKEREEMMARNEAKEAARRVLGGWVRNGGDDFGIAEG